MSPTPDNCFHLGIDSVREIHAEALKQFGGLNGVRDENLLASAVLAPQSTFGGRSPYADIQVGDGDISSRSISQQQLSLRGSFGRLTRPSREQSNPLGANFAADTAATTACSLMHRKPLTIDA